MCVSTCRLLHMTILPAVAKGIRAPEDGATGSLELPGEGAVI